MKSLSLVSFALAMTIVTPAFASDHTLQAAGGGDTVFVWKVDGGMDKGMRLIAAGVHKTNPVLVMQNLACIVDDGESVVMIDAGFASHTIMVTSGPKAGCEGDIPAERLKR